MGSCLVGYAGFRIPRQVQSLEVNRTVRTQAVRAYDWLRRQHPHRVFINTQEHHTYLQHMALGWGNPPLPLHLAGDGPASGSYDYLVLKRGNPVPTWANRQRYQLAYRHADLVIYRLNTDVPGPVTSEKADVSR